jgi:hypothetical protein
LLLGTPSFVRLPGSKVFQEVYVAKLDKPLSKGDSGSWIKNPVTGKLFGHVIAGSPTTGLVLLIPAARLFAAALATFSAQAEKLLPRLYEVACNNCQKKSIRCNRTLPNCFNCSKLRVQECVYDPESDHHPHGLYRAKTDTMKSRGSIQPVRNKLQRGDMHGTGSGMDVEWAKNRPASAGLQTVVSMGGAMPRPLTIIGLHSHYHGNHAPRYPGEDEDQKNEDGLERSRRSGHSAFYPEDSKLSR